MTRKLLSLALFLMVGASAPASADVVNVGRAAIAFPEGDWQALTSMEGRTALNAGASGVLPTDDRAFILLLAGQLAAILYLSSSKSGTGIRTNWTNTCHPSEKVYAANLTANPNALECAKATGSLKTDVYLKLAMPHVLKALDANRIELPPVIQSASATVGSPSGTMLHINLLAVPAFSGLPAAGIPDVPPVVKPAHAAWAQQLARAARESVFSMSGQMSIPPVVFAASRGVSSTSQ